MTPALRMGSDESHFKVSLIVRDKFTRQVSTSHSLFEEKGELKRNRAEALLLTSLTPYRWATPTHYDVVVMMWSLMSSAVGLTY